jgi:NAD(P)-dependent dehydrogenase (short-subunit alcohol dehydrogenase family)
MFAMDRFRLDGRTALVIGAASGIGQGIALGLAQAGASVACFDRDRARVEATVSEVSLQGRRALALTGDVTRADDLASAIETLVAAWGALDIAANA